MSEITTREAWIEMNGTLNAAIEAEDSILSVGRECLPPVAIAVLDGEEPTAAYWSFLGSQVKA